MTRTYNPADPDQAATWQQDAELRRQQMLADWRWLAAAPQGRRILAELMLVTGLIHPAFSEQPLVMARNEGRREIGAHLHSRFTQALEGAGSAALLAEVLTPPHERDRTRTRADRRPSSGA